MGTLNTPTPPTPGGGGVAEGAAGTASDDQVFSFPQNGYVDKVHVYVGAQTGTTAVKALVYRTDTGAIIATSNQVSSLPTGHAWVTFSLASFLRMTSGFNWSAGAWGTPNLQFGNATGAGNYWWSAGASPANREAGTANNLGNAGHLYYYLEYFPDCTVTSVDAGPFAPGQSFQVHGTSFTSGVTSITLNGTTCPTYTVNSDTLITVTVPAGATSGTVTVNTNAGSATSSGTVTVSSARAFRTGAWSVASAVDVERTAVLTPAGGVYVLRTSVWTPGG